MTRPADPIADHITRFLNQIATPDYARHDRDGLLRHALSRDPARLAKAFNRYAVPYDPHHQPARELAAAFNLAAIGRRYRMPRGISAAQLEAYTLAQRWAKQTGLITPADYTRNLEMICADLTVRNPALAKLRFDKHDEARVFDVILGATSGFNPTDIQFYIDGNYHYVAMMDKAYVARHAAAEKALGTRLQWVPAPKTLDKIISQRNR